MDFERIIGTAIAAPIAAIALPLIAGVLIAALPPLRWLYLKERNGPPIRYHYFWRWVVAIGTLTVVFTVAYVIRTFS
jgi:hypothetical protein